MATQVQHRRGTTAQHSTLTGAAGEITVDTTKNTAVVHDGSTSGGTPLATEAALAAVDNPAAILTTQGDILYRSTSGTARLPIGTSGQYLKGGTAPTWANPTASEISTAGGSDVETQLAGIVSAADNGGPNLLLIETITVPAGGLATIERTVDTVSVPYAFKGVMIDISTAVHTSTANLTIVPYDGATALSWFTMNGIINTSIKYGRLWVFPRYGLWASLGSVTPASGLWEVPLSENLAYTISKSAHPVINKIKFTASTGVIPAGTVIKIWGAK